MRQFVGGDTGTTVERSKRLRDMVSFQRIGALHLFAPRRDSEEETFQARGFDAIVVHTDGEECGTGTFRFEKLVDYFDQFRVGMPAPGWHHLSPVLFPNFLAMVINLTP